MVPDPYALPKGCKFHPRCGAFKAGLCDQIAPEIIEVSPGHRVRCFRDAELG
ncbi:MAG: hypothetical protein MUQ30_17560 [Anaerolineae bacterium]|nr:hypothetical protein [Anaerolineae bacterium]